MNKIEDMISATKLNEILHKRDEDKIKKTVLWILAIVGAIVAIGAIAYAVYRFVTPNYLEDFEDDFEDEFEDDFEDDYFEEENKEVQIILKDCRGLVTATVFLDIV